MRGVIAIAALGIALGACTDTNPTVPVTRPSMALVNSSEVTITSTDLGTLGGAEANATDVNNLGHVVGWADLPDGLSRHAFLWTPDRGIVDLGDLGAGSSASAVNDLDEVVGVSRMTRGGEQRAFLWTSTGGMRDLGALPGTTNCVAQDINTSGEVVGNCSGLAFRWSASTGMVFLGELQPGFGSYANAINDHGDVVGAADVLSAGTNLSRAFLWTPSNGIQSLGTLDPADPLSVSFADDINDAGTVIGTSFGSNPGDFFLWSPASGMRALGEDQLLSTGRINDQGDITAGRVRLVDGTVLDLGNGNSADAISDRVRGQLWVAGTRLEGAGEDTRSRAMRWTVAFGTVVPPTPEQQIEALLDQISELAESQALTNGEANALSVKLQAALESLARGAGHAVVNQLEAFVRQVTAFELSGRLTAAQADGLREAAFAVIASLHGE